MTGIQFVTDDKGRKTAVLIALKKHGGVGGFLGWPRVQVTPQGEKHPLSAIPG